MKAIAQDRYGSEDILELREVEKPAPRDGEVLVRVRAAGVDPGVWHLMTGVPYLVRIMGFGFRRPKVPIRGNDFAGVVEAVGAGVVGFAPGDEVFGTADGTWAEYVCAREDRIAEKPASLSFEQAAAMPTSASTALQGLRDHGGIAAGQQVLIVGAAGGVGSFGVQVAKSFDATVTGVCSTAKADLVRSLGAEDVIDYRRQDFTDGTRSFELILDTAGGRPLRRLRRALAPRGTLVIIGAQGGGRWIGGVGRMLRTSMLSPFVSQRLRAPIAKESAEDLRFLAGLVEAGRLTPVLDRTYPLAEAPEAIRYLSEGHARGKTVLTV